MSRTCAPIAYLRKRQDRGLCVAVGVDQENAGRRQPEALEQHILGTVRVVPPTVSFVSAEPSVRIANADDGIFDELVTVDTGGKARA